jgi:hypothetical protein
MDEAGFHLVLPMLDAAGVEPVVARIQDLLARMPIAIEAAEVELTPVFTIMLNNPYGANDIQLMVKELAIARERPPEESPIVIRAKAVVEEPVERE